ncbi:hypothetical protein D9M68_708910 [compost metagenome]
MRRLGARRHIAIAAVTQRAGRAVAEGEDVVVAGGLQGRAHHQLVDAVAFQSVQILQQRRCANARRPDLEAGGDLLALCRQQAIGGHLLDCRAGHHGDAKLFQGVVHRGTDALRQGG